MNKIKIQQRRENKRYTAIQRIMRILQTSIHQQIGQPRRSGANFRIIQPSKSESGRNRKYERTDN